METIGGDFYDNINLEETLEEIDKQKDDLDENKIETETKKNKSIYSSDNYNIHGKENKIETKATNPLYGM